MCHERVSTWNWLELNRKKPLPPPVMQRKTCDIGTDQSDDSKNGVTSPYVMKRSIIQNSSVLCRNTATLQRLQRLLPKLLPRPFTFTKRAVDSDSFSLARREQTSHRCYEGKRRESEREKKIKYAENQRSPVPTDASGASTSSVPARTNDRGKFGSFYIHLSTRNYFSPSLRLLDVK